MAQLKNAEIFSTGTHNGLPFTEGDLDAIVSAFNDLGQSGRVPLKLGHDDAQPITDGQPALGWVGRIWRRGAKLMADFIDVPSVVFDAIKQGLYKFVSIELLTDAQQGDSRIPFVLDAVALLGADIPAVGGLADLQRLTATRAMPAREFSARLTFKQQFVGPDEPLSAEERERRAAEARQLQRAASELAAENTRLKAELEAFKRHNIAEAQREYQRSLMADIEQAVRDRRILPAARERLIAMKRLKDPAEALKFSRDELGLYLRSHDQSELLRGLTRGVIAFTRDPAQAAQLHGEDNTERFAETHAQAVAIFARERNLDIFSAWPIYMREHPDDGRAMTQFCFEP